MAQPVLAKFIQSLNLPDLIVVSPDAGGVGRAKSFSRRLGANLAIIDKRRPAPNVAQVFNVIGDVRDKNCVLFDDIVDTAGTLVLSAEALTENGAKSILAACTHPVLSGQSIAKIEKSAIEKLIVSNTIPLNDKSRSCRKVITLSVAEIFGEAIRRINEGSSVSSLFV
jgi:ribose-phosphate pyrophosphokinase